MIFNKEYFEKAFENGGWECSTSEYERVKYARQLLALQQQHPRPERILEIGCGEGIFTGMLATAFPEAQITCVDICEAAIKKAKQSCRSFGNIEFTEADVIEVARRGELAANAFDVIIQSECLYYLFPKLLTRVSLVSYLRNTAGSLRNGGIFLTSNGIDGVTKYVMSLYYSILKRFCSLEHAASYREWNEFRSKYTTYDLKVFRRRLQS